MQVHTDLTKLPTFNKAVITIGTFDGVHTGHLKILEQLKHEAERIGGESVIITFDPHPRMILPGRADDIKLLNTLKEKIKLLQTKSIDHLVVVPFTELFSQQSAEQYIKDFIVNLFHPHTIIIGYDHHFGRGRKGNYLLLELYQEEYNYRVNEIPEHVINKVTISSTRIREALLSSDIKTANKFLGYSYSFEGTVVSGDKIGRTLGYPTANLEVLDPDKLLPGNGIYAIETLVPDFDNIAEPAHRTILKGMMSIGVRPTIGGNKKTIEVHILDFTENLYGKEIRVFLKFFLRPEIKFNTLEELKTAIAQDEIKSRHLLR